MRQSDEKAGFATEAGAATAQSSTVRHSRFDFQDFDLYMESVAHAEGRSVQLDSGPFRIGILELAFGDFLVRRLSSARRLHWEDVSVHEWTGFVLCPGPEVEPCSWRGVPVRPHTLTAIGSGPEHAFLLPAGWVDFDISVSNALLLEIAPEVVLEMAMTPERAHLVLSAGRAGRLWRWLDRLFDDAATIEAAMGDPERAKNLRWAILEQLLQAIEEGLQRGGAEPDARPFNRYALVRRALDCVRDREGHEVLLNATTLSQELGVSRRSVERAFRDVFDLSPYQYLLRVRLNSARSELLRVANGLTVAQVAANHGFCSASEFAQHYTRLFREYPSVTLGRRTE